MTHSRLKTNTQYRIGDLVLAEIGAHWEPVVIEGILPNAYMSCHGFMVRSPMYPSMESMMISERYILPMVRTQSDLRKMLRVIK